MNNLCVLNMSRRNSERMPFKNRVHIGGQFNMMRNYKFCLPYCSYQDMFLYSDDEVLANEAEQHKINVIDRPTDRATAESFFSQEIKYLLPNFSKYKYLLVICSNEIYIDETIISKLISRQINSKYTSVKTLLNPFLLKPEYAIEVNGDISTVTFNANTKPTNAYFPGAGGIIFDLDWLRGLAKDDENVYGNNSSHIFIKYEDCIHIDYQSDYKLGKILYEHSKSSKA